MRPSTARPPWIGSRSSSRSRRLDGGLVRHRSATAPPPATMGAERGPSPAGGSTSSAARSSWSPVRCTFLSPTKRAGSRGCTAPAPSASARPSCARSRCSPSRHAFYRSHSTRVAPARSRSSRPSPARTRIPRRYFPERELQPDGDEGPLHRCRSARVSSASRAGERPSSRAWPPTTPPNAAPPAAPVPADLGDALMTHHEDLRSPHPHDLAHHRRLRGDGAPPASSRIVEPAFWLGQPRTHVGTFEDYFQSLLGWERFRASQFGIRHFCTIGAQPEGGEQPERVADGVLALLPRYLDKDGVVAVGEIGYDDRPPPRSAASREQIELARDVRPAGARPHAAPRQEARHRAHARAGQRAPAFPRSAC